MKENDEKERMVQLDESVQSPKRKTFQGFSMGFLLILLAITVGLYVVCTIIGTK